MGLGPPFEIQFRADKAQLATIHSLRFTVGCKALTGRETL
jgi:hypothetical protein